LRTASTDYNRLMLSRLVTLAILFALQATEATTPPADVRAKLTVNGVGVQIYVCTQVNNTFQWQFQRPQATLFDPTTRKAVGTHSEGPTWTWNDGSAITGKVLKSAPAPDKGAIAWLLLETRPTANSQNGALSHITMVRRSNTQAGIPASPCGLSNDKATVNVPYQAIYTFYEPVN
jgi:hypothetical protein